MAMMEINWHPSRKDLRVFAVLLVVFFGFVSWSIYHNSGSREVALAVFGTAAAVSLVGFLLPSLMRWVYVGWMIAVFPIGWVVSHLFMGVVFYLVITPVGLIMKLLGHDPMRRKFDRNAKTYWTAREENDHSQRYFRQF